MAAVFGALILPRVTNPEVEEEDEAPAARRAPSTAPPQGKRKGWVPRSQADFGDGGAFPEVHVAQFPLEMGRKGKSQAQTLALTTDASGRASHATGIAGVGQREGKIIHSGRDSIAPKILGEAELARPDEDAAAENTERTRLALEALAGMFYPPRDLPWKQWTRPETGPSRHGTQKRRITSHGPRSVLP